MTITRSLAKRLDRAADQTPPNLDQAAQILFKTPLPNLDSNDEQLAEEEQRTLFRTEEDHKIVLLQLEARRLQIEVSRLKEKLELEQDNRKLRTFLAKRIFRVTGGWLLGVYLILLLSGFKVAFTIVSSWIAVSPFYLSDTVLAALLGATSVLGLLAIILRGLFAGKDEEKSEKPDKKPDGPVATSP